MRLQLLDEEMVGKQMTLPYARGLWLESPARDALTDLRTGRPITVPKDERLEAALERMIHAGVRLLFSTDQNGALSGVVTSYDIQGEKPVRFLSSSDCLQDMCRWQDVRVRDIHTPVHRWPAIALASLEQATVAHLMTLFADPELSHLLVVERLLSDSLCICGLISRADVQRRLDGVGRAS